MFYLRKINGYWVDKNNNRWDVNEYNYKDAKKISKSMIMCKNCTNCNKCYYCEDCFDCVYCLHCRNCNKCWHNKFCNNLIESNRCENCNNLSYCDDCVLCENLKSCYSCIECEDCENLVNCCYATNSQGCINCSSINNCKNSNECDYVKNFNGTPDRKYSVCIGKFNFITYFYQYKNRIYISNPSASGFEENFIEYIKLNEKEFLNNYLEELNVVKQLFLERI